MKKTLFSLFFLLGVLGWAATAQRAQIPAVSAAPLIQSAAGLSDTAPESALPAEKAPERDASQRSLSFLETATQDQFGYTWITQTVQSAFWLHGTSAQELTFVKVDDDYTGTLQLGFDFPFYQKTYNALYVSTNGLVSFGAANSDSVNQPFPITETKAPKNLAAALWDDLVLCIDPEKCVPSRRTHVYTATGVSNGKHYLAVEWFQIGRLNYDESPPLTFEVILFENGDIVFQYLGLDTSERTTIGIVDSTGTDGLMYSYNAASFSGDQALKFIRPPSGARVRVDPPYSSGFVTNHRGLFSLNIVNTTDQALSDIYNLSYTVDLPAWSAAFYKADGKTLLTDSAGDADATVDTGSIAAGEMTTVTVKVLAPADSVVGDHAHFRVNICSARDNTHCTNAAIEAVSPARFAQGMSDGDITIGVNLILTRRVSQEKKFVDLWFSGSKMAVVMLAENRYLFAWERNKSVTLDSGAPPEYHNDLYTNAEYVIRSKRGELVRGTTQVLENSPYYTDTQGIVHQSDPNLSVFDRAPSAYGAADGKIGLIWLHRIAKQAEISNNWNVYYTVLDKDGNKLLANPVNVTENTTWIKTGSLDTPVYSAPRIVAMPGNQFWLFWYEQRETSAGTLQNVAYAIYNAQGEPIKPPTYLTQSVADTMLYGEPSPLRLPDDRLLVAYDQTDQDFNSKIVFTVFNSDGSLSQAETAIPGADGSGVDICLLNDQHLLFAWTKSNQSSIAYAVLESSNFSVVHNATILPNPDLRASDNVSVTDDGHGYGILTWLDSTWNRYLYYALVGPEGELINTPIIFYIPTNKNSLVATSITGQGNAPYYMSEDVFAPVVVK